METHWGNYKHHSAKPDNWQTWGYYSIVDHYKRSIHALPEWIPIMIWHSFTKQLLNFIILSMSTQHPAHFCSWKLCRPIYWPWLLWLVSISKIIRLQKPIYSWLETTLKHWSKITNTLNWGKRRYTDKIRWLKIGTNKITFNTTKTQKLQFAHCWTSTQIKNFLWSLQIIFTAWWFILMGISKIRIVKPF